MTNKTMTKSRKIWEGIDILDPDMGIKLLSTLLDKKTKKNRLRLELYIRWLQVRHDSDEDALLLGVGMPMSAQTIASREKYLEAQRAILELKGAK